MERNTTEDLCTRSLGWLQQQDKDAKQWLWKFSNCFAAAEQNLSFSTKTVGFAYKFAKFGTML